MRRYQCLIDEDYKKNKICVCAHLFNIYNSFVVAKGRQNPNYFDIDKWTNYQYMMYASKK